jgi:hypothetical protein
VDYCVRDISVPPAVGGPPNGLSLCGLGVLVGGNDAVFSPAFGGYTKVKPANSHVKTI